MENICCNVCVCVWIFRWNRCFVVGGGGDDGVRICFLGFFIVFVLYSFEINRLPWIFSWFRFHYFFGLNEPITQILIKFTYFHSFINGWLDGWIHIYAHRHTIWKQQTKWFLLMESHIIARFWTHVHKRTTIINIIWYESNLSEEKGTIIMLMRWMEFAFISVWLHCIIMEKRTRKSSQSTHTHTEAQIQIL